MSRSQSSFADVGTVSAELLMSLGRTPTNELSWLSVDYDDGDFLPDVDHYGTIAGLRIRI